MNHWCILRIGDGRKGKEYTGQRGGQVLCAILVSWCWLKRAKNGFLSRWFVRGTKFQDSRQRSTRNVDEAWVLSSPTQVMANSLPLEDYQRYGRQMILEGFGLDGQ